MRSDGTVNARQHCPLADLTYIAVSDVKAAQLLAFIRLVESG
jgi:hypothetical protein